MFPLQHWTIIIIIINLVLQTVFVYQPSCVN
jgi:hypothetical protein